MITQQRIQQIIRNRGQQGFSPRAIAYQIEKENRMSEHLCIDCGQPMESVEQKHLNSVDTIVTCKNKLCSMWSVTLTTDSYAKLTQEQLTEYRQMVFNLKKRFGYPITCLECNGVGHTAIKNGDNDQPCPKCAELNDTPF